MTPNCSSQIASLTKLQRVVAQIERLRAGDRYMSRDERRAANAADPLRQRQVPKKERPRCGSRADGWHKPCRAPVLGYRDETGAPRLRTLCFRHWNAQQAKSRLP